MHSKFNMRQGNVENYKDLKAAVCFSHFATTHMNICEFVYVYKSITYLVFFYLIICVDTDIYIYKHVYLLLFSC